MHDSYVIPWFLVRQQNLGNICPICILWTFSWNCWNQSWEPSGVQPQSNHSQVCYELHTIVLKINSDYWAAVFLWNHYTLWIETKTSMFQQYFITTTLTSVPIHLIIDIWHLILHICTSVVYLAYNYHLEVTNCWNTE